ncbi:MAG: hypothetical protein NTW21_21615 [Verrucomicrobia bacterium]|nr:hypothetical protein [Verrucomicrobiota bacterium]
MKADLEARNPFPLTIAKRLSKGREWVKFGATAQFRQTPTGKRSFWRLDRSRKGLIIRTKYDPSKKFEISRIFRAERLQFGRLSVQMTSNKSTTQIPMSKHRKFNAQKLFDAFQGNENELKALFEAHLVTAPDPFTKEAARETVLGTNTAQGNELVACLHEINDLSNQAGRDCVESAAAHAPRRAMGPDQGSWIEDRGSWMKERSLHLQSTILYPLSAILYPLSAYGWRLAGPHGYSSRTGQFPDHRRPRR